jgi:LPS export ABC transporter protein LptC
MMKRLKLIILVVMVAVGGFIFIRLWANLKDEKVAEKKEEVSKVSNESADMSLEKIRLVEDKHGRKTWELEAKAAQQNNDQNIMILEEIKVTYYTEEGRSIVVTGKQGKVHQNSKDMELVGDVKLTSSDGYTLKTNSLSFSHEKKKVTTPDVVEIEGDQMHLVGTGMQVDMEAQTFKILNRVKTQWRRGGRG